MKTAEELKKLSNQELIKEHDETEEKIHALLSPITPLDPSHPLECSPEERRLHKYLKLIETEVEQRGL